MSSCISLIFFFLLSFLTSFRASAKDFFFLQHYCLNTTNFSRNGTFFTNRRTLLSSLSSRDASYSTGFQNATVGEATDPDKVTGLFLCRGDVTQEVCRDCVAFAVNDTLRRCPNDREAVIYYDECMLRYSDRNILSTLTYDGAWTMLNGNISTNQNQKYRFEDLVSSTMNQAAFEAANSSRKIYTMKAKKGKSTDRLVVAIVVPITVVVLIFIAGYCFLAKRAKTTSDTASAFDGDDITTIESLQLDYRTIQAATSNYSENNKIGQGGFGEVYKGTLSHGTEVAVKKLSKSSGQGDTEFKNEVDMLLYANSTQELGSSPFPTIYAIAQCNKDLTLSTCNECLLQFLNNNRSCCRAIQGGYIARTSCFMQWDLRPLPQLFGNLPTPPELSNGQTITTKKGGKNLSTGSIIAIAVVSIAVITVLLALGFVVFRRKKAYQAFASANGYLSVPRRPRRTYGTASPHDAADDISTSSSSLRFDFREIKAATSNFHKINKLGHGGFGSVYKGMFPNGTEVAAKRLSKTSDQSEKEFKNEVLLVAKLQHRNLVKLLGFSAEGEEKILVYEFVPNKSLDHFLFDPIKRVQLDWARRHNVIEGITRGILYLHQDSRLTIIHRDLKASNILLDAEMNPKIADFGMARKFRVNQTEANTGRVVGTFGYMPPEYVANGQFSTKSDVYSFGVLILEIIGGKKNSSFHRIDGSVSNLVTHVWRLRNNASLLELVDPAIGENYDKDEVIRCIHIGLLCVQENPGDRPRMSTIFRMLTNASITLPVPQPPGFFFRERTEPNPLVERLLPGPSTSMSFTCSVDNASITSVRPR